MRSIFITAWLFGVVPSLINGVTNVYTVPSPMSHYVLYPRHKMVPGHYFRGRHFKQRVLIPPIRYYRLQQFPVAKPIVRKIHAQKVHHRPRKSGNDKVHLMTLLQNRNKVLVDRGYRMFKVNRNKPLKKGVAKIDSQIRKRTSVGIRMCERNTTSTPYNTYNNTVTSEKDISNVETTSKTPTKPSTTTKSVPAKSPLRTAATTATTTTPTTTTPPPATPPPKAAATTKTTKTTTTTLPPTTTTPLQPKTTTTTTKLPIRNNSSPASENTIYQKPKPDKSLCVFTVDCGGNVPQRMLKLPNLTGVTTVREIMSIIEGLITNLFQNKRTESSFYPLNGSTNVNNASVGFGSGNVGFLLPLQDRNVSSTGVRNIKSDPKQTHINTTSRPGIRNDTCGALLSLLRLNNGTGNALNMSSTAPNIAKLGGNLTVPGSQDLPRMIGSGYDGQVHLLEHIIKLIKVIRGIAGDRVSGNNMMQNDNTTGGLNSRIYDQGGRNGQNNNLTGITRGLSSIIDGGSGGNASQVKGNTRGRVPLVNNDGLNPRFLSGRENISSQFGSRVLGSGSGDMATTLLHVLVDSILSLNNLIRNRGNVSGSSGASVVGMPGTGGNVADNVTEITGQILTPVKRNMNSPSKLQLGHGVGSSGTASGQGTSPRHPLDHVISLLHEMRGTPNIQNRIGGIEPMGRNINGPSESRGAPNSRSQSGVLNGGESSTRTSGTLTQIGNANGGGLGTSRNDGVRSGNQLDQVLNLLHGIHRSVAAPRNTEGNPPNHVIRSTQPQIPNGNSVFGEHSNMQNPGGRVSALGRQNNGGSSLLNNIIGVGVGRNRRLHSGKIRDQLLNVLLGIDRPAPKGSHPFGNNMNQAIGSLADVGGNSGAGQRLGQRAGGIQNQNQAFGSLSAVGGNSGAARSFGQRGGGIQNQKQAFGGLSAVGGNSGWAGGRSPGADVMVGKSIEGNIANLMNFGPLNGNSFNAASLGGGGIGAFESQLGRNSPGAGQSLGRIRLGITETDLNVGNRLGGNVATHMNSGPSNGNVVNSARLGDGGFGVFGIQQGRNNSGTGQSLEWRGSRNPRTDIRVGNRFGRNVADRMNSGPSTGNVINSARLGEERIGAVGLNLRRGITSDTPGSQNSSFLWNNNAGFVTGARGFDRNTGIWDSQVPAMDNSLFQMFGGRLGSLVRQQNIARQSPELLNPPGGAAQETGGQNSNQIGGSTQQMGAILDILRQVLRRNGPDVGLSNRQPANSPDLGSGQGGGIPNNVAQNIIGNTNNGGASSRGNNNMNGTPDLMSNIAVLERLQQRLNSGNGIPGGNQEVTSPLPNTARRESSSILLDNISTQQMGAIQDILRQLLRRNGPDVGLPNRQPANSPDLGSGQGGGVPNNVAQNIIRNTNNAGAGFRGNNNRNGTSDLMPNIAVLERLQQRLTSGNGITGGNQEVTSPLPNTARSGSSSILLDNISNILLGPGGAGASRQGGNNIPRAENTQGQGKNPANDVPLQRALVGDLPAAGGLSRGSLSSAVGQLISSLRSARG